MSTLYRCDRCGNIDTTIHRFLSAPLSAPGVDIGTFDEPLDLELCHDCFAAVLEVINQLGKETT